MSRVIAAPLLRGSTVWRCLFLLAAWSWAGGVIIFYYSYHFARAGSPWMRYDGRTYYTHPAAQTLAQGDHVSAEVVTITVGLAVLLGTLDLVVRLVRRMTAPGIAAITAGGVLTLVSLFGLLRGLLGMGTAGILVILSGLPMKSTAATPVDLPTPPGASASWYADPTGRYDVRYWDGDVWRPHVATAGRPAADPL